jgi:hypothetical protein
MLLLTDKAARQFFKKQVKSNHIKSSQVKSRRKVVLEFPKEEVGPSGTTRWLMAVYG